MTVSAENGAGPSRKRQAAEIELDDLERAEIYAQLEDGFKKVHPSIQGKSIDVGYLGRLVLAANAGKAKADALALKALEEMEKEVRDAKAAQQKAEAERETAKASLKAMTTQSNANKKLADDFKKKYETSEKARTELEGKVAQHENTIKSFDDVFSTIRNKMSESGLDKGGNP